jgi:adenylate cyclase class 2
MYEVELKVRADHDAVRDRLRAAGAERTGAVAQVDTYYDHPGRDFATTDEALRVRAVRPLDDERDAAERATRLTYKGPLVDESSKTREEFETGVTDGDAVEGVLERLDFAPAATVRKERETFTLSGYTVALDAVEGLDTFVEVEREVESGIDEARAGAERVLERLDLDPADGIRTSYLGLSLAGGEE